MNYGHMCPHYEKAAQTLGKKWVGLILRVLLDGPKRFGEFKAQLPELSDRILSERLKELEDEGLIERRVHDTRPVTIEYGLTQKGKDVEPVVKAIQTWAEEWW